MEDMVQASEHLPEEILEKAFHLLFGPEWKISWSRIDKANEMRSVIRGNSQPCAPFCRWISVVDYLSKQVKLKKERNGNESTQRHPEIY
jgi:hypothetical protein